MATGPTEREADVHPGRVLGALGDPGRLRIFAAVVLATTPAEPARLVEATGLPAKRVQGALKSLEAAGLIRTGRDATWEPVPSIFGDTARLVARMRPMVEPEDLGATPEQAPVIRAFFTDGRLTQLPAQQTKRAVVLDFVAQQFEPGRHYDEPAVNRVLDRLWDDHATLRRALVDEGFLDRRGGFYWRSGGTVDVDRDSA